MEEIKAIIQPFLLDRVLDALHDIEGLSGVTVFEARLSAFSAGIMSRSSKSETAPIAHLDVPNEADDALLAQAANGLHDTFNIEHVTLQIECGVAAHLCPQRGATVV